MLATLASKYCFAEILCYLQAILNYFKIKFKKCSNSQFSQQKYWQHCQSSTQSRVCVIRRHNVHNSHHVLSPKLQEVEAAR